MRKIYSLTIIAINSVCFGLISSHSYAQTYSSHIRAAESAINARNGLQAVVQLNKAIEMSPNDAYAYFLRGQAFLLLRNNEGAEIDFTRVIGSQPSNKDAYYLRGVSRLIKGNNKLGCSDISQAADLGHRVAPGEYQKYCL